MGFAFDLDQVSPQEACFLALHDLVMSLSYVGSLEIKLETDKAKTLVEGTLILDKPRLIQVDGIMIEAALTGHITFMKNRDVPGVIGYVGSVMGKSDVNIANFTLGRQDVAKDRGAIALVETDSVVPDSVLEELRKHPAVLVARNVELPA